MKRSVAVPLVMMGTLALTACEDPKINTAIFSSVEECISNGTYTKDACLTDFQKAQQEHAKNAPAFANKADCESEFGTGQCEQSSSQHATGSNSFLPFMMGYMMGGRNVGTAPAAQAQVSPAQALYKQPDSQNFVNAGGTAIANRTGPVQISSRAARPAAVSTNTLSRGGFGARSMSISA